MVELAKAPQTAAAKNLDWACGQLQAVGRWLDYLHKNVRLEEFQRAFHPLDNRSNHGDALPVAVISHGSLQGWGIGFHDSWWLFDCDAIDREHLLAIGFDLEELGPRQLLGLAKRLLVLVKTLEEVANQQAFQDEAKNSVDPTFHLEICLFELERVTDVLNSKPLF